MSACKVRLCQGQNFDEKMVRVPAFFRLKVCLVFLVVLLNYSFYDCAFTGNFIAAVTSEISNNSLTNSDCPNIMATLNDVVRQLEAKKTSRYPPVIKSEQQNSAAVTVSINILPLHLTHVDDAHNRIALGLLVLLYWHDPRLAWAETTEYDHKCKSKLPARLSLRDIKDVWAPIFVLAESTSTTKSGLSDIFESLQVGQNGTVYYAGRYRDDLICPMKRRYYPFDEQICNITVLGGSYVRYEVGTSWKRHYYSDGRWNDAEDQEETLKEWALKSFRKAEYETHIYGRLITTNEWKLNPTDKQLIASLTKPIPIEHAANPPRQRNSNSFDQTFQARSLVFQLFLKRDAWPLVRTMVIPPIAISVAGVAGMYLGCPISSRFGFGATIIISLSLLIRRLNDRLETGDDGSPLMEWLYLGLFINLLLATIMSKVPHALAKRRKKRSVPDDIERSRRTKYTSLVETAIGVEGTINLYFAIGFLLFQALVIGYVVTAWFLMPTNQPEAQV